MEKGFELFDHTADMGIRVCAESREGLIWPAACGLYAAFGELAAADAGQKDFTFHSAGTDDAVLLRDFLTELLILFERDHRILTKIISVEFPKGCLSVAAKSAPLAADKCVLCREVKAVTYHGLEMRMTNGGYEATLIVDI